MVGKEGGEGGECLTWWIVTTDDFGGGRAEGPWRCNLTSVWTRLDDIRDKIQPQFSLSTIFP
jgi:hypothetical protein